MGEVKTVTSTIVSKKDGTTKTGKVMVSLELSDVNDTVWAFAWGCKGLEPYKSGDTITLDYEDIGKDGKTFNCLKKVHSGSPTGGSEGGSQSASVTQGSGSKGGGQMDQGRRIDMYTSYTKDLVLGGMSVKKALSTLAEIQEGVKNLLNPPQAPANTKGANPSQEGRIRSLVNQIGLDTDEPIWKNHVKKRYGTLTHDSANSVIDVLQGVLDGTHSWAETPDGELVITEKPVATEKVGA